MELQYSKSIVSDEIIGLRLRRKIILTNWSTVSINGYMQWSVDRLFTETYGRL